MNNIQTNHTFVVCAYKESNYIEECIQSLFAQTVKSNIVIATSTPNDFICNLAQKYDLELFINDESKGIGFDFDFAVSVAKTDYVTVAHQDDLYCEKYLEKILKVIDDESLIIFTHYFEGRNSIKEDNNTNLKIKKILLSPLKINFLSKYKFIKRLVLAFGCPICCPAVTFNKKKLTTPLFASKFKCDVDWYAWERISKLNGRFNYISEPLMVHRIHEESTTSEILEDRGRIAEDYEMFKKFWPNFIAKILVKFYSLSEKSNNL